MKTVYLPVDIKKLSHDLRTPLTSILGTSYFLDKETLSPQQQDYLKDIQKASHELLNVINNLLSAKSEELVIGQVAEVKPTTFSVLVVEDDPIIQKVHTKMLETINYKVDIASSGKEALFLFEKNHYDVIMVDVNLPDMCGYEIADQIRLREPPYKHTSIIAISADVSEETKTTCLEAGVDSFTTKPVEIRFLQKLIQHIVAVNQKHYSVNPVVNDEIYSS